MNCGPSHKRRRPLGCTGSSDWDVREGGARCYGGIDSRGRAVRCRKVAGDEQAYADREPAVLFTQRVLRACDVLCE